MKESIDRERKQDREAGRERKTRSEKASRQKFERRRLLFRLASRTLCLALSVSRSFCFSLFLTLSQSLTLSLLLALSLSLFLFLPLCLCPSPLSSLMSAFFPLHTSVLSILAGWRYLRSQSFESWGHGFLLRDEQSFGDGCRPQGAQSQEEGRQRR